MTETEYHKFDKWSIEELLRAYNDSRAGYERSVERGDSGGIYGYEQAIHTLGTVLGIRGVLV